MYYSFFFQVSNSIIVVDNVSTMWNGFARKKFTIRVWRIYLDRVPTKFYLSNMGIDLDLVMLSICQKPQR